MVLEPELMLSLYGKMCRMRAFELGLEREHKRGNVPGMLHTGLGHEATLAAISANLTHTDSFFPYGRCHGLAIEAGTPGEKVMAELFGRATGIGGGKGGPHPLADPSVGNYGVCAVIGSSLVTAFGAALGWKLQNTDRIAAVIVGDGASGRGEWHESMNLASTWKVPLLYCIINNGYAISTPVGTSHPTADLCEFAQAYRMPAIQVDGNDITAAYEATRAAVEHVRSGKGPYFIEYKTWRWQGLWSGEFRPAEEVRYFRDLHDPVKMARQELLRRGIASEVDLAALDKEVDAEIEGWIDFAKSSPQPDPTMVTANVYAGMEVASR